MDDIPVHVDHLSERFEATDFCSCKICIHYIPVNNIRTVQQLLGHSDVSTTEIYTHVIKQGNAGVKSPIDF